MHQENERLEERVRDLETAAAGAAAAGARRRTRLRELLGLRQILPLETVAAEVVARDGMPWFRTLTLDSGSEDGRAPSTPPVISPTGVVGRVIAVGPRAAKVQLLLDRESGGGRADRAQPRGRGRLRPGRASRTRGADDLVMKYVPVLADVVVGDVVVTSGLDRIYPKGLVVGTGPRRWARAPGSSRRSWSTPSARFDQLEEVLVVDADGHEHPALSTSRSSEGLLDGGWRSWWRSCSQTALGHALARPGARRRSLPAGRRLLRASSAARPTACWRARPRAGCRTSTSAGPSLGLSRPHEAPRRLRGRRSPARASCSRARRRATLVLLARGLADALLVRSGSPRSSTCASATSRPLGPRCGGPR